MYNKGTWIIINATSKLSHGYNTVYISPITMYALLKINLCFGRINIKEWKLHRSVYHIQANNSFHVVLN